LILDLEGSILNVEGLYNEKIIIISDVHLGDKNCQKKQFEQFLDQILNQTIECNRFVIVGDFFDMWRRDSVGVMIENAEIIEKLIQIEKKKEIKLHFVVGNHDYYLRNLKQHGYPFQFNKDELVLNEKINGEKYEYRFCHGYKFDMNELKFLFDIFCFSDDNLGEFYSSFWQVLRIITIQCKLNPICIIKKFKLAKEKWKKAEDRFGKHITHLGDQWTIFLPPSIKEGNFPTTEKRAFNHAKQSLDKNDKIFFVFGHTHKPFIYRDPSKNINLANTGSWVVEDSGNEDFPKTLIPNTFIRLSQGKFNLHTFIYDKAIKLVYRSS
jgi:UDP-2,3-diacylglucosamine pyrophosphatase LpxH